MASEVKDISNLTDAIGKMQYEIDQAVRQYREGLIMGEELSNKVAHLGLELLPTLPVDHNPTDPPPAWTKGLPPIEGQDIRFQGCPYGAHCRYIKPSKVIVYLQMTAEEADWFATCLGSVVDDADAEDDRDMADGIASHLSFEMANAGLLNPDGSMKEVDNHE